MSKTAKSKKKIKTSKSQEIVFKEPSLFRKIVSFITAYSMMFLNVTPVFATNITGVAGNNGVYNIEAAKISGNTGFRQYTDFTLDSGDVANLKYDAGYTKFVNMVDNQVNINGIVNTVKGNNFYNGHAIFVSPNGIVVGASGVLNVGSLTMATPNSDTYNNFKDAFNNNELSDYIHGTNKYNELLTSSNGNITINGKIMTKGDVELYGKNITIEGKSGRAGIVAGVENQSKITSQQQAKQTFDALVSNNIKNADTFSLEGGKIKIKAGSTKAVNSVKSAKIEVKNADLSANEVEIEAKVESSDKIDMAKTEINIENTYITAEEIDITAESKREHDLLTDNDYVTGLNGALIEFFTNLIGGSDSHFPFGATGTSEAKVTVKNSVLRAIEEDIAINAIATYTHKDNLNLMKPALLMMLIDLFRDHGDDQEIEPDDANFLQFFSSDIYEAYDGPRTRADVTIDNSKISADSKNIEISAEASSELKLATGADGLIIPIAMYGFGTGTVARAIVKNKSELTAEEGNVTVDAYSENSNDIEMVNAGITSLSIEDFFLLAIINNTVKTSTEAKVEDSTVNTKDLNVRAVNVTSSEVEIEIEALAGMADQAPQQDPEHQTQGNSAISGIGILHRSDNNVTALIKNSTVTADNVSVLAQSLNSTLNSGNASVDDPMVEKPRPYSWMQWERNVQDKLKNVQRQYINKSLFNRIKGGGGFKGQQGATLEAGGVFVWSNTQNKATAKIENSTITAEKDVSVQANTVDVLRNMALSDTAGEENFSVSLTAILNEEKNTTTANVDKSTIEAKNLTVNATTEMPMNRGEITLGMKFPFKIKGVDGAYAGFGFDHEANQKWDWDFVHPEVDSQAPAFDIVSMTEQPISETYGDIKPKIRWKGFFNNFAQTNGIGQKAAIDGSFIYNNVENNTTASITDNSDITLNAVEKNGKFEGGNLTVNAVNSVIGYNALGMIDILVRQINYRIPGQINWKYEPQVEAGKFGLGVNFLWDTYTNNAVAKIDNSEVEAKHGNVSVSAANEQEYVTAEVTGGKSEFIGIEGSTNVQKRYGETTAQILNSEKINAGNIEVNAGKAKIRTAGNDPKTDENTHEAKLKAERDAEDVLTTINFLPAWSVQSAEQEHNEQTTSSGVAVGAGVDVTNIERDITAEIKDSTIVSEKNVDVKADTYSQTLNLIAAAAWSGGISQPEQQGGQQGGDDNQPANQNDLGNVQQNMDDAQDEEGDIFGNLFDGEEDFMQQPVGNAFVALSNKFSLSVAGAVLILTDKTNVGAKVSGSNITVGNNMNVTADRESRMLTISGGLSKAGKIGLGAAVDIYKSDGSVKANVTGSTIKFNSKNTNPDFNVTAHNTNKVLNIAIGAGLAPGSDINDESLKVAIGGSYNMNTLKPIIEAIVQNSNIEATTDSKKLNATVKAENDVVLYDIAGGGSYINGGSTGLGVGAAINYNNIKHTISAYVNNSVLKNLNKLSVTADADNDLVDFAVAGTLAFGADTSGWTFDGSAVVDYIHDTIAAKVLGSTVDAADDIIVRADSNSDNLGVAGTLDISLTNSGAGVNGDVVINVFRNTVTAEIGNSYKEVKKDNEETETVLDQKSKILKAKDITIAATSTEKSNVIAIGTAVGTGGQFLMAAANVGVDLIDNTVKAYLSGDVGKGEGATAVHNATVAAYDETTLYSRGGTVGVNASQDAFAVFAGSVNVDKIDKTVEAKIKDADIKATGDVSTEAYSINSMGGTKNDDNKYTRDDVTSEAYREKMLHKDTDTDEYDGLKLKKKEDGEGDDAYIGLHQDSDFWNWNMFFDISASYKAVTISGTGIGKVISNTVTAEITGSKIEANNLNVIADDYSIKNIIAGTISGSGLGSVGLQVLYTKDNSTTSALITNGSELTVTNALNMDATNAKDNHHILVVGVGAMNFAGEGNLAINKMTDKAIAKIDNVSTEKVIKAGTIAISAIEDMNASHIVVAGGGASMGAITVSPIINTYDGTTEAVIKNAHIKDAAIDMDAESDIDTLDVSVGIAGAKNLGGVGIAIKNDYSNKVKSYIDQAIINTTRNIFIDANSIIDSVNWLAGVGGAGQGAGVAVNVLLNDVHSELEAGIKNSTIEKSGDITINTNKDKKDKIVNRSIAAAVVYQGATPVVNVIKNVYENTVKSYVDNTGATETASLTVNANSDRKTENLNAGFSAAGQGAGLLAAATVHEITSTTEAYVDAKSKTVNITGALSVDAKDQMIANNMMAAISAGIYGGALNINVDLFHSDNLVKAEILSAANGQINAGSSALKSAITNAHRNAHLDLTFGGGTIPIDVQIIETGKRTGTYSDIEKTFIDKTNALIPGSLYTPITNTDEIKTGAISRVAGNLKTANDTKLNAETQLKGVDADGNLTDKFEIDNTHVTVAGLEINVGVRKMNLASNTVAEISGGKVESTQGDVKLNAKSKSDVKIDNTSVEVGLGQVSGRSVSYKNSAETTAQIKDATVNAKDIDVEAKSDNKVLIDATNVIVSIGGVVTVDLLEAIDVSKNVALITGNTNINATGALSLHANATSDVSSLKSSVPVQIVDLVNVSRNRAEVSSVARAIIENVNGTIKTNGLNITTDYDKMYVYSKSNIVAVKPIDFASYDDSGAFMNASFKSGIDSEAGLTLNNSGTTNIITAKDNQADQSGMVVLGNIHDVHVSLVNFYSGAFSKAENTATSATVMKVKDHTSNNLNIEQYLNTSATAEASKTKVTILGFCNAVSADAKDTSTMTLDIGGSNSVVQNAIINATHQSKIKSDLFNFNLGVIVSGGRIRIASQLTSNTTSNIIGNFNAKNATVNINTYRDSTTSKGSGSGGFINVSDTEIENTLEGDSILNIKDLNADNVNNWNITNKSENIFDFDTRDGSGGFINVSLSNLFLNFKTSTNTNVENTKINSNGKIQMEANNKEVLRETAWNNGGGVVSVINNYTANNYTTGAKLLIKDSQINARDLDLKVLSDMRTQNNDYIEYSGTGGGFVAVSFFTLSNTLTQTSEIELQNSVLNATHNAVLQAVTSSLFKQKMQADYRGFVAVPRFSNTLTVNNTNKLTLDDKSKILADDKLDISFNSNNDLAVYTFADARNFEGVPAARSYLYLTINNLIENNGSLQAGNLVDIDYMDNSINTLYQYAHTENDAFIASTTEEGILSRTINNTLNVNSGADITSGKDINIGYSIGIMTPYSEVSWVTNSLWFIEDSDKKSVDSPSNNYSLKNDGLIVAGQGNNRYMRINSDGTIDKSTLQGFYDDDYIIYDGNPIDGQTVKDRNLDAINIDIQNINDTLNELEISISELDTTITYFQSLQTPLLEKLNEINDLLEDGYVLTEAKSDLEDHSAFNTIIQNDLLALIISEDDENKITQEQYDKFINDYSDKLEYIRVYNYGHTEKQDIPTIVEFINANDYGLTEAQIENIKSNYKIADDAIIGEAENQISQEKFDEISNAYQDKLTEIDIYNYGHDDKLTTPTLFGFLNEYGFTDAQVTTISEGYNTISANTKQTAVGKFTTYENANGKYVAVTEVTETANGKTCNEIKQLQSELNLLNNQIEAYASRKASNAETMNSLNNQLEILQAEYEKVSDTDAQDYTQTDTMYSIVFNDIISKDAAINIDGAYNANISGNGEFKIATGGVTIDNYSTRSLLFGLINVEPATTSGLFISGKNHSEFANKPQAVSGYDAYAYINNIFGHKSFNDLPTDGVHFISDSNGVKGMTVNNWYDVNHPMANTFDIPNPTAQSHIFFTGDINTRSLNVWNESGHILTLLNILKADTLNMYATNGQIGILMGSGSEFSLNEGSNLFAADTISINADSVDIKGNLKTGYSERSIKITEDMLDNLIEDPITGEVNMIDLGGDISPYLNATNNIKALYKDGQIYLYNMPKTTVSNGVKIATINGDNSSGSITGNITFADGYQKITIDNQTDKPLNVADITNSYFEGEIKADGVDVTAATITKNTNDYAETNITSNGNLLLNGIIRNNVRKSIVDDNYLVQTANGKLNITAANGLNIAQILETGNIVDSIFAGGLVDITVNGGETNIAGNITDKGSLEIYNYGDDNLNINGNITDTSGDISIQNNGAGKLTLNGAILAQKGDISVLGTGTGSTVVTNAITAKQGDIFVVSKGLIATEDAQILAQRGNIDIINNADALALYGSIRADNGDISVRNNGSTATVAGYITDEQGDLTIINTNGDMTLTSEILHNYLNPNADGMITIINNLEGGELNIQSAIQTWGEGKTEDEKTTAVLIDNRSETNGMTIANGVSARVGDIVIKNAAENLVVSGDISNTETGGIYITDNGSEDADISGKIITKNGDIELVNNSGNIAVSSEIINQSGRTYIGNNSGILTYTGSITNDNGDVKIAGRNDAQQAQINGTIVNKNGNTDIVSENGALTLSANVSNSGGNLTVVNNGTGTEIGGKLNNEGGNIVIDNSGGDLTLTSAATINSKSDGDINIINNGDGKLALSGVINNNVSGDLMITNSGANGAEISGTITNAAGDTIIENKKSDLLFAEGSMLQNTVLSDIEIQNTEDASALVVAGTISTTGSANVTITNSGSDKLEIAESGKINIAKGELNISNDNDGAFQIAGVVDSAKGNSTFINTSDDGMIITTTGQIINQKNDIQLNNSGAAGMQIEGKVTALQQSVIINNRNSDLVIGEYASANDNYVQASSGNVIVNQTGGDVLNGIVDPEDTKHQNADLGNPEQSYKTLIAAKGNLIMNVKDGNIGYSDDENAGFTVEASSRDWTDSINVNVGGNITATATNDTSADTRLINLRAKDSDLKLKSIKADGNVLLTAADWKQADVRPTPEDDTYFQGYSIVNKTTNNDATVFGQNISLIASNNIGGADKKLKFMLDTATNPQSVANFEAENDIYASGNTNSDAEVKINQIISKRGNIVLDLDKNATINKITAAKGVEVTEKAQNLTILDLGMPSTADETFDDMLNPHDDLVYGDNPEDTSKSVVPEHVILRALDAMDTPERGNSNIKVYSMTVRGNNNKNSNYYQGGGRLADVTLMADNVYANSDKAPDSSVPTKSNPEGYKQTQTSYSSAQFGFGDDTEHSAQGINTFGEGDDLSIDVLGVDKKAVNQFVRNPQRNQYATIQTANQNNSSKFRSGSNNVYSARTQNAVLSVNDYASEERGVVFDALYADNAYINTLDTDLKIQDGYVKNYAEIRNGNRVAGKNRYTVVIDNDYHRLVPANIQLYTAQTGNFGLTMNEKIKLDTPAPVIHYEWDKLVRTFNDENSFVRLGLKETELRQKAKDYYALDTVSLMPQSAEPIYDVWQDDDLSSDVKIIEISRIGATIINRHNWQVGEVHDLNIKFDDVDITVKCEVVRVKGDLAQVEFKDLPADVANKITNRYMKMAAN